MPVVVHLVHGTWPFGPFRRESGSRKAWFEAGSPVREAIAPSGDPDIEVREFRWSGRNSLLARGRAAVDLLDHLERALDERPDTKHVIIAHSHGGTVAAHALSMAPIPPMSEPRIKALVCIATPFAYLRDVSEETRRGTFIALAYLLTAALWLYGLWQGWLPSGPWIAVPFLAFLPASLTAAAVLDMLWGHVGRHPVYRGGPLPRRIPAFLIRATRDEASLVLGVCQAIQSLAVLAFKSLEGPERTFRRVAQYLVMSLLMFAFVLGLALAYVHLGGGTLPSPLLTDGWVIVMTLSVLVVSGQGLPLVAGRVVMAIAVGDWSVRGWPRSFIEVDAAPPDSQCRFKSYSDLGQTGAKAMRHGLYEHPGVQAELRRLIRAVAAGEEPRLLNPAELDHEAEAADTGVLASLKIVRRSDLRWCEAPPMGPGVAIIDDDAPEGQQLNLTLNVEQWIRETRGRRFD